ncbi:MAG TPA: chromate efflux transporter [Acidiferrobacteraceae bacterium]|nr:chromate efflux transporter [Acidiferrobacteraceae bacterium]HEX20224.1 chromate efflux transporter [Acidiferrobacteraceae bacterium]
MFLKIGSTAFGGFMALISVVENMIVSRRKLMRHDDMLDGISLASMLPGPVAVNVVAFVGYQLRGFSGAAISATAVILPSFVLIIILTAVYFQWGSLPVMDKLFMGFLPAVSAIIFNTAWGMSRKTIKTVQEGLILAVAAALLLYIKGFYVTFGIIASAALVGLLLFRNQKTTNKISEGLSTGAEGKKKIEDTKGKKTFIEKIRSSLFSVNPVLAIPFFSFQPEITLKLFLTFAGMSLMLFGGGYVFIPMIQKVVVDGYGWLTQKEFIDAIAMGQVTPGPILISATFIGYKIAGVLGAISATVGIFLPPILLMIFCTRVLDRIRKSNVIKSMLQGIRPAVIGMIFAAAIVIAQSTHLVWTTLIIFVAAMIALMRFRVEVVWVIPTAGLAGLLLY